MAKVSKRKAKLSESNAWRLKNRKEQEAKSTSNQEVPKQELTTFVNQESGELQAKLAFIKEEVLAGIKEGMDQELKDAKRKSTQETKRDIALNAELMKSLLQGIEEGMNAEISQYAVTSNKTLAKSIEDLSETLRESLKPLKEWKAYIQEKESKDGKDGATGIGGRVGATGTRGEPGKPGQDATRQPVRKDGKVSDIVLSRKPTSVLAPKLGMKATMKRGIRSMALGALGMGEIADYMSKEEDVKRSYIEGEKKLRAKEFAGKDTKEVEHILSSEYEQQTKTTKQLKQVDEKIRSLKEAGYSEEQINELGVMDERQTLERRMVTADKSRLGEFEGTNAEQRQVQPTGAETKSAAQQQVPQQQRKLTRRERKEQRQQQRQAGQTPAKPIVTPKPAGGGKGALFGAAASMVGTKLSGAKSAIGRGISGMVGKMGPVLSTVPTSNAGRTSSVLGKVAEMVGGADIRSADNRSRMMAGVSEERDVEQSRVESQKISLEEKQVDLLSQIVSILAAQKAEKKEEPKEGAASGSGGGILDFITSIPQIAAMIPQLSKAASVVGTTLARAASFAGPALGVVGAGAAGYMAGKYVVNPILNKAAETITGTEGETAGTAAYTAVDKVSSLFGGSDKQQLDKKESEERIKLGIGKLQNDQPISADMARFLKENVSSMTREQKEIYDRKITTASIVVPGSSTRPTPSTQEARPTGEVATPTAANVTREIAPSVKQAPQPITIDKGATVPEAVPESVASSNRTEVSTPAATDKTIVVQAPAPTVNNMTAPAQQQVSSQPFNLSIKNKEPTIGSYIRSRYLPT